MDEQKRALLLAAVALGATAMLPRSTQAESTRTENLTLDPIPALPTKPTPGKPGDFDFLHGSWRISHARRPSGAAEWDRFEGEATCWSILGGVGSVEELRIPARSFSGMGLRLLDVEARVWSDFWVNAKSGVLTSPGQTGSFENGAGLFASTYEENGKVMTAIGVWDRITPTSCRWRQAVSADGGKSWEQNWIMDWQRV